MASSGKDLLKGWFELDLDEKFDAEEFVALLKQQDDVISAFIEAPTFLEPCVAPNDTDYGSQWH